MAATALSWWLGHDIPVLQPPVTAAFILVVTFIKVGLVVSEFMEVGKSQRLAQLVAYTWLLMLCAVLIFLYLVPVHHYA